MINRRKRKPQQREAVGKTKAYIILCLLDGEKDRTEISEYLKTHHNIINRSNVKDHLYGLVEMGLIEQGDKSPGKPRPYHIPKGFDALKNIFLFLRDQGMEAELLQTGYFNEAIESKDFRMKLIINAFKEMLLAIYQEMLNDNSTRDEADKELKAHENDLEELNKILALQEKTISQQMDDYFQIRDSVKTNDENNIRSQRFKLIINTLENNTVDQLYEGTLKLVDRIKKDKNAPSEEVLRSITDYLIPEKEKDKINDILRMSPSANEHILNIKAHNSASFMGLLFTYLLYTVKAEQDNVKLMDDSPIVRILKAAYIIDHSNGKTLHNNYSINTSLALFEQLFLPRMHGGDQA